MQPARLGPIETIALRFGWIAYVASAITIVREWGNWSNVWKAAAAMALASPLGILLSGIIMLPIAYLIGRNGGVNPPPRLAHNLVNIIPVCGLCWAIYLCAQSFG